MRFYFFILVILVALIGAQVALRSFFVIPLSGLAGARSGYELAAIDFDFFSSLKKNESYVSQGYGRTPFAGTNYADGWHNGIDIVAPIGASIMSASDGKVIASGNQDDFCYRRGFGKFVIVRNANDDKVLLYAHLGYIKAKEGSSVKKNDVLGFVGETGFETAPHLHFSVFNEKNFVIRNKNSCGPGPDGNDISPFEYLKSLRSDT